MSSSISSLSASSTLSSLYESLTGSASSSTQSAATTEVASASELIGALQDSGALKNYFSSSIGAALLTIGDDSGSDAIDNLISLENNLREQMLTAYTASTDDPSS